MNSLAWRSAAGIFLEEKHPERPIVNHALDQLREPAQQQLEIENGRKVARNFDQRLQRLGFFALAFEQSRIFERHRHVRAKLAKNRLVAGRKLSQPIAQEIECANDPALATQRYHELRARSRNQIDIAWICPDVIDQLRGTFLDRRTHGPFTNLKTVGAGVLRIAHRIGHADVLVLFVQQVHGKRRVVDETRNELRDLLEEFLEIEHRRYFTTERKERGKKLLIGRVA